MTFLAKLLVRGYRLFLSPVLGGRCKYHPTCSQYALDALDEYGALRGTALAAWRVVRCNPWSHGGVDRVRDQRLFPNAESRRARPGGAT